jgi:hypothetical protein
VKGSGISKLTQINVRIKVVLIILLKPDSGWTWCKAREGQSELTQVNIKIKLVIIIILKPESRVDL